MNEWMNDSSAMMSKIVDYPTATDGDGNDDDDDYSDDNMRWHLKNSITETYSEVESNRFL